MVAAYSDLYMWKQAVEKKGTTEAIELIPVLEKEFFDGPVGIVFYQKNHCVAKKIFLGKIRSGQQFDIIWDSKKRVLADPYPLYRTKAEWNSFLQSLYEKWGGRWIHQT
jgi:urea transport system substrate-binding protein